jgi:bifunctional non-homologous end joining protein LigD
MLPTAGRLPLGKPGWLYEFKWDGVRCLAQAHRGAWRLVTRHGRDITRQFPELAAVTDLGDVILDGELVILDGLKLNFGAVVARLRSRRKASPATVLAFDVLRYNGSDLRRRPLEERRELIESLDLDGERWIVPPAYTDGAATEAASVEHGLEGVVAKKLSSPYVGGRSRYWIKARRQAVIDVRVIGWVRRSSGGVSLLLAEATPRGLVYVGRCRAPAAIAAALAPFAAAGPEIPVPVQSGAVHWTAPVVAVEVIASSREPDGRLRQPRFVRARLDELE